jgi:hypothetical protein
MNVIEKHIAATSFQGKHFKTTIYFTHLETKNNKPKSPNSLEAILVPIKQLLKENIK